MLGACIFCFAGFHLRNYTQCVLTLQNLGVSSSFYIYNIIITNQGCNFYPSFSSSNCFRLADIGIMLVFSDVFLHVCGEYITPCCRLQFYLFPAMPLICLHLSALMNAPGRLQRRQDELKEVILDSKQMCLILGICIMLLRVRCALTRRFLNLSAPNPPTSSSHQPDTQQIETCCPLYCQ